MARKILLQDCYSIEEFTSLWNNPKMSLKDIRDKSKIKLSPQSKLPTKFARELNLGYKPSFLTAMVEDEVSFIKMWEDPKITKKEMTDVFGFKNNALTEISNRLGLGDKARGETWNWEPSYSYDEVLVAKKLGYQKGPKHLQITHSEYYNYLEHYNLNNHEKFKDGEAFTKQTDEWKKDYKTYLKDVWRYTNRNDLESLTNYNLRGRGIGAWHLDHKFSIFEGFRLSIVPWIIGSYDNLEMLPQSQNVTKGIGCSINISDL